MSSNEQSGLVVTEDDLAYAAAMWHAMRLADDEATSVAAIATSLAAEREKARAPFRTWMAELQEVIDICERAARGESKPYRVQEMGNMADGARATLERIRCAVEDDQ